MTPPATTSEPPDADLLKEFLDRDSEPAFATLVGRYLDIVYSAARRQVHDPHLAEDVTQSVFMLLATKARELTDRPVLTGWLITATRLQSRNLLRARRHAQARERKVAIMSQSTGEPSTAGDPWEAIRPHLDEALEELAEGDRDAVVLRYFRQSSYPDIAAALGVSEGAVRQRVSRGVERLRQFFGRKGLGLSAVVIASMLRTKAVEAAPAELAGRTLLHVTQARAELAAKGFAAASGWTRAAKIRTLLCATSAVAVAAGVFLRIHPSRDVLYLNPAPPQSAAANAPPAAANPTLRRAFETFPALSYQAKANARDGSGHVGYITDQTWLRYADVDLRDVVAAGGTPLFSAVLTCPDQYQGAEIVVHVDATTGPVVGRLKVRSTGGYNTFFAQTTPIQWPAGVHDVYLTFTGGGFNLQAIRFLSTRRSAAAPILANSYNDSHDVQERTYILCETRGGSWVRYDGVDFDAAPPRAVELTYGCDAAHAGGAVDVAIDSSDGPSVCRFPARNTGGFGNAHADLRGIAPVSGRHDVYLRFTGGRGVADVWRLRFLQQSPASRRATP